MLLDQLLQTTCKNILQVKMSHSQSFNGKPDIPDPFKFWDFFSHPLNLKFAPCGYPVEKLNRPLTNTNYNTN